MHTVQGALKHNIINIISVGRELVSDSCNMDDKTANKRSNLDDHMSSLSPREEVAEQDLTSYDILLGKGRSSKMHTGNVALRTLVASRTDLYRGSPSRSTKIHLIVSLTNSVYEAGGRFLNNKGTDENRVWVEVGRSYARAKVSNSIRDAIKLINKGKPLLSVASFKDMLNETSSFHEIVGLLVGDREGGTKRSNCSYGNQSSCCFQTKPMVVIPSLFGVIGGTTSARCIETLYPDRHGQQEQALSARPPQRTTQPPHLQLSPFVEPKGEEYSTPENCTVKNNPSYVIMGILPKELEITSVTKDLVDSASILTLGDRVEGLHDAIDDDSSFEEGYKMEQSGAMDSSTVVTELFSVV